MDTRIHFTAADWKLKQTPHSDTIAEVLNGVIEHCINSMNCSKIEAEQVVIKAMTGYSEYVTGESYTRAQQIITSIFEQKADLNGGSAPST